MKFKQIKIYKKGDEIKCLLNNSVMRSVKNRTKPQNQKLKTLCTLDTTDIILTKDVKQLISKKRIMSSIQKANKTNTRSKSITKSHMINSLKSKEKKQRYSNEKYNQTIVQTRSINSDIKPKRSHLKSRQRVKTEHEQTSPNKITLSNLDIFTTVKNVKFHIDEQYNVDPFYIINTLKSTKEETVYTVKYLDHSKKSQYYIMKKSNHPKLIEKYQREIAVKETLTDLFKPSERKNFSCIYKTYKKDKHDNMHIVYYMEGEALAWKKPLSQKLIHNLHKNDMEILKHLIVEISKAIHILSAHGYYHSELRLKNILVQLKQDDQNVKVSKVVKLGNLGKCHKITDKKSLQSMPHSIYTPPQILNFIMFQQQNKNFKRNWLQYLYKYEDGWKVNVWSLGVLILQLLNQQPFHKTFIDLEDIIQFQQDLGPQTALILDRITDETIKHLLKRMLSPNPKQRPSPEHIILTLTSQ